MWVCVGTDSYALIWTNGIGFPADAVHTCMYLCIHMRDQYAPRPHQVLRGGLRGEGREEGAGGGVVAPV